jgi:hypothetical protein
MLKNFFSVVLLLFFGIGNWNLLAQQVAFPGAEGSGRFTKGGRGGEVYEVTTLANSGAGSIVDALSQGNRTIVFRVSGTIELGDVILQPKANITIAGQTAPGDGICIKGRFHIKYSDIIIRYLRVRVDAGAANSSGDAVDIDKGTNIMIDHVSASYARDEGISCQETSDSVTVQWCIISEALTFENHSYGSLIRGDFGDQKTYHHNLYAHDNGRLPRPGNYTDYPADTRGLFFDFRNNVVYNWKGSAPGYNADTASVSNYNFVGNVYIPGDESSVSNRAFKEDAYRANAYFADNMYNGTVPTDQWSLITWGNKFYVGGTDRLTDYKARSQEIIMEPVTTTSPEQAYTAVLATAGCSYPKRDTIDRRIINDVINQTGHSIDSTSHQPEGGWPLLSSLPAPTDTDHDGMPDDWELANSLNPGDASDRNLIAENGYTMLENYLNGLVEQGPQRVTPEPVVAGDFLLWHNYPNPFNAATTIQFSLFKAGITEIRIYDLSGRVVRTYPRQRLTAGEYRLTWLGDNDAGKPVASGIYFCTMQFAGRRQLLKMQVLR